MPWPFFIPEFLKRRACRYLLHHYLGQYLGGRISLEDLTIDLYNGTGSLSNVPLNVEAVNEVLNDISAPVRVVSGYIGRVCVSIPWSALMRESCTVEISGLCVTIAPSSVHYGNQVASMTDSLFFSTSTSQQLAQEVLKSPSEEEDEEKKGGSGSGFEGMDALAKAIETVLLKVQIKLLDTTVSICHQSKDKWNGLNIRISSIEFFDEVAKMEPHESEERDSPDVAVLPEQKEYAKKIFQLSGLQIELTSNDSVQGRDMSDSLFEDNPLSSSSSFSNGGTPIASASGDVNVTIKMRQLSEEETGGGGGGGGVEPKLDIEANVGAVHVLLYPKQLHQLIELVTDITDKVKQSLPATADYQGCRGVGMVRGGPVATGYNRPIPQQAMRRIETQLVEHMETQRKLRQAERERQQLDPWDHISNQNSKASPTTLTPSNDEVFYSFDLNSDEHDSANRMKARPGGTSFASGGGIINQRQIITRQPLEDQFQLGGGVGLQQLSGLSSSPSPSSSPHNGRRGGTKREEMGGRGDELCHYTLVLSGITVALLEANPIHTYSRSSSHDRIGGGGGRGGGGGGGGEGSLLMQESDMFMSAQSHVGTSVSSPLSGSEEYRSLDEGGLDPVKYFESVWDILNGRVNRQSVGRHQEQLGRVLPTDHLFMWMSTVRVGITAVGDSVDVDVSIASAEMLEFLYHNEASIPDIKPVSVQPLIQLKEDSKNARPGLKLKINSSTTATSNELKDSSITSLSIEAQLLRVHVYLDVTLLDRLHPLLHPPHQNATDHHQHHVSLGPINSDLHNQLTPQALFTHAMATGSAPNNEQKVSVKILTDSMSLSLRFPVADLSQTIRPPWYRTPLRPEVLFLDVSHLSFSCLTLSSSQRTTSCTFHARTIKAYFSLDGSEERKELFLVIGTGTETNFDNELNTTSVRITFNQFDDSPLDQLPLDMSPPSQSDYDDDDDEFDVKVPHSKPSPFSQKKDYFSGLGKSQNGLSSDDLLLPATQEEMSSFKSHLFSTSTYSLSASIPCLSLHIPSQVFLQRLYNRFATDLLLWEPATPAAVERATARSLFYSNIDMLQPAVAKEEKFKLCRSALMEDSYDEDTSDSASQRGSPDHTPLPTYLSVLLNIREGHLSLALPVEETNDHVTSVYTYDEKEGEEGEGGRRGDERYKDVSSDPRLLDLSPQRTLSPSSPSFTSSSQTGVLIMEFRGGSTCLAIDYKGEAGSTELCLSVEEFQIQHCPRVHHDMLYPTTTSSSSSLLIDTGSLLLHDILKPMSEGLMTNDTTSGEECMLSLAVESRTETDINRKVHKCAVKISRTLFEFHVTSLEDSFIKQVSDMFDLKDDHVPGYDPPTVITELHSSLLDSAIQYRPLYIPTHAVLSLDSLRVSSTLVTGSPLLVVKVLLDDLTLSISDKRQDKLILRNGFVNVMEMGSIDFILRLCNKNESTELLSDVPSVDFQCSGSELRFMTCVDSSLVLRDLLIYLSESRDLTGEDTIKCSNTEYKNSNSSTTDTLTNGASNGTSNTTTNGEDQTIIPVKGSVGDLISEAMEDFDADDTDQQSRIVCSPPGTDDPVPVSTTTAFIFSSDSEGEEIGGGGGGGGVRGGGGGGGGGVRGGMKHSKKKKKDANIVDDGWVIDEDDYCILSTPTTAKVGPGSAPVVKCLLSEGEELRIIDNYFAVPDEVVDQLKSPQGYPKPEFIYSLRELTIVWQLYGGRDFSLPSPSSSLSPLLSVKRPASSPEVKKKMKRNGVGLRGDQKRSVGGMGRDQNKLVEIEISKLRLQHETYPSDAHQSSRVVILIHDIEIRDRVSQSLINKFLYQYCTDALPRQSLSNMFSLKVLFTRPEAEDSDTASTPQSVSPSLQGLEASVRLSLLPIRLNIDQDTFLFLHDYFQHLMPGPATATTSEEVVMSDYSPPTQRRNSRDKKSDGPSLGTQSTSVFIKSFVFYPDVPIRIDYEAKRLISEQLGTFAGLLLGLSHLDNSEVTLKSLTYKQGILGWDQLFECVINEWLQDIGSYQLPRILQGVGPMYHVTQLFHGVVDLFWLPVQQYQEDGRIVWGLQRGTYSFASSSGVAVVELTNRVLYSVQSLAQTAFDMVSPSERSNGSLAEGGQVTNGAAPSSSGPHQSADLREGFANAYNIVTMGLGDTAREFYQAASVQHTDHGVTGAVGGVLRHIPGNIFRPIIFASEATRHVLGGAKNQFVPEARREAAEKWKVKQ